MNLAIYTREGRVALRTGEAEGICVFPEDLHCESIRAARNNFLRCLLDLHRRLICVQQSKYIMDYT